MRAGSTSGTVTPGGRTTVPPVLTTSTAEPGGTDVGPEGGGAEAGSSLSWASAMAQRSPASAPIGPPTTFPTVTFPTVIAVWTSGRISSTTIPAGSRVPQDPRKGSSFVTGLTGWGCSPKG